MCVLLGGYFTKCFFSNFEKTQANIAEIRSNMVFFLFLHEEASNVYPQHIYLYVYGIIKKNIIWIPL